MTMTREEMVAFLNVPRGAYNRPLVKNQTVALHKAFDIIDQLLAQSEWQDIATAPKGMEYLDLLDDAGYTTYGTWFWRDRWADKKHGTHLPDECWINMRVEEINVTHWRYPSPLPQPPKEETEA